MSEVNAKISVTKKSDEALDRMLSKVNDGFMGGRITKQQLASWLIERFEAKSFEKSIEVIRRENFDELAYLEGVLKTAKMKQRSGEGQDIRSEILSMLASSSTARPKGRVRPSSRAGADVSSADKSLPE